ncbi:MAG: hypothetical protein KGI54_06500 [Pseudomonadota bacterium]|nr:hypothetical protein [Pseudomonadota bacterium]
MSLNSILSMAKTTGQIALACTAVFALMRAGKVTKSKFQRRSGNQFGFLENIEHYQPNELADCHWLS